MNLEPLNINKTIRERTENEKSSDKDMTSQYYLKSDIDERSIIVNTDEFYTKSENVLDKSLIDEVDRLSNVFLNSTPIREKINSINSIIKTLYEYNSISVVGTLLYINSVIQMNSPETMISCNLSNVDYFKEISDKIYKEFGTVLSTTFKNPKV